ncbi:hypothetical protein U1Q18_049141 [Sarracenia purpurea var. burkii]
MPSNATMSNVGTMRDNARLVSGAQPAAKQKANTTAKRDKSRAQPTTDDSRPQSLRESTMRNKATRTYGRIMRDNTRPVQGHANLHRHVNKTTDQSTPRPVHDHTH